jgi:predicted RNase H-like nuclease (RuvC/YqgF family)
MEPKLNNYYISVRNIQGEIMGYWKEVREVLGKGVHLAAEGIKEGAEGVKGGAESVFEKTKDSMALAKLNKDLKSMQEEYQETIAEFGDDIYDLYTKKKDVYEVESVKSLAAKVSEKEKECKRLETEIKNFDKKS